ncbi:hypothetical protein TSOC_001392 [Tetrabaena socialis]|uniref:Uncharacterized protein n=1 Tax=Tetrabaena socialis TaxID=47790 RepID=A0A2J8AGV5_9CHLO|nr:hypothetical protein TSOC_001392 [Tetrabaena socialis]|eukprot:PNH11750.1 hypothetical protein TSOC_001392 [Tetrabaena socialis]
MEGSLIPIRPSRGNRFSAVAAVMTGSRISRQPTASKPARKPATARSSPPASPKKRTFFLTYSPPEPAPPAPPSRSSLPAVLAGLSGVGMLGAAVWLLCGPVCPVWCHDPTTLAATAVSASNTIHQYGPADLVTFSGRTFGPTRPVWALLLHHQQTAHAAAAAAVGEGSWSAGLAGDTRAAAESAAAAAHGTFEQLRGGYNTWLEASPLPCKVVTGNFFTIAGDMLAQLGNIGGGHGGGSSAAAAGGRKRVDLMRTLRLCLETSLLGTPLAHFW